MAVLRILNLEDEPLDTEILRAELAGGGLSCEISRVQKREDFLSALRSGDFDLVLADHSLPTFDGLAAMEATRKISPETPFIFVSGTIGEEAAIESIKRGATDYVLKHRLDRLVPAVRRAVREARERAERARAEEELRDSHALLRSIVEGTADPIFAKDVEGRYLLVNSACAGAIGRPVGEILGKHDSELYPPEVAERLREVDRRVMSAGEPVTLEEEVPVGGILRSYLVTKTPRRDHRGRVAGMIGVATDITERLRAEKALFDIREAERRRIARDLHDIVLQDLTGALQGLQAARVDSARAAGLAPEVSALRRAVDGLRNAIYDLRLEGRRPFLESLRALVELNRRLEGGCETSLTLGAGFPEELPEVLRVELVRILQEALANVRRHSGARRVRVVVEGDPRSGILAEVEDDGRGFDPSTVREGVGLSAMRERAREIGGELEVESAAGEGTRVRFRAPLSD
ncbi:MAG TPA: PAS domain-containing protein [Rubrobacteraceae bacterium]|nr:PAS domain-containing protein [Rubrobacteraceae bacterium]